MSASFTDLGSTDITLTRASPASDRSKPLDHVRAATCQLSIYAQGGYLAASYGDVYFDISGVFPAESVGGQEALIRQELELVPTNKIMWSGELFIVTY